MNILFPEMKKKLQSWVTAPKLRVLMDEFGSRSFRLLDIGSGNHSASEAKAQLPCCEYYGVDRSREYNNDARDFALMSGFYELDLTLLEFKSIPDNFFDAILLAHVIEHLHNGDAVIQGLLPKLKRNGVLYIEYPGQWSTKLPSMRESLNYYDDPTHVRLYSIRELTILLAGDGVTVISAGTRRSWRYLLLMPVLLPYRWIKRGYLVGGDVWDLFGFAEYIFARKD